MSKLREAREKMKMTQTELAEKVGVDQKTISRWEENPKQMSLADGLKLSEIVRCRIRDLLE